MTDENSPHIQRASQINLLGVCVGLIIVSVAAYAVQFLALPKSYTISTKPSGAKVYVNNELRCQATPCELSLYGVSPYKIILDRPQHLPHIIELFPFNRKLIEEEDMPIRLEPRFREETREQALATCRKERDREIEKLGPGTVNMDAKPCFRAPAVMPWQAARSGHCHVVLDIETTGHPTNIRLRGCTEDIFITPTKDAVRAWRYVPALKNGEPILRKNAETRMKFRLNNAKGHIIPEAPKFANDPDHTHDIGITEEPSQEK